MTFFTTQVDFTYAGDLKVFVDEDQITAVELAMGEKGYLDGTKMATAFNMLRSGDLIWPYVINNYMRGKEPMPFDLLYWNADSTRMAAANHSYYLSNCYLENSLSQGHMVLAGRTVSLSDITIPVYNLASRDDHIAPAKSVFLGCKYFGGEVEYVMAGSGHIAGVVNPPSLEQIPALDQRKTDRRFPGNGSKKLRKIPAHGGHTGKRGSKRRTTAVLRLESPAKKRRYWVKRPASYVKIRV